MSTTVDNRVVEMRFDNKNFESNVATSMSTLEKLKQSLNLTGATKGLEKVDAAAKNVNFSGIGNGIETVKAKFSALEVIGVTALANLTNSAVNAGKKIVSALTIDPITTGFKEYETQINAVQTILANTSHEGTNLEQVNAALDELNLYADKTIYNFTEMTRNIGTFTAAGVNLETSVSAIKGIANLAAMSGSTSQQASTAMYQLSQAIAAGRVSLQDWNSVVNAGMGGKVFQDALMNTAEAMGIAVDRSISFRESISTTGGKSSWLTSDVLLKTLEQFTGDMTDAELAAIGFSKTQIESIKKMGDTATEAATKVKTLTQLYDTTQEAVQSGWAQSWRLIVGDFEQARETFSKASDYIGEFVGKVSDARNEMLKGALTSPWEQLTEKVEASGVAVDDFKKALKETAKEHGIDVDKMIDDQTTFEETLKNGWLTSDIIIETLKKMSGGMDGVSKSTEGMADKLEYFQKVVNEVWRGDFKNGKERIEALTAAGYNYAEVQALVNKTVDGHKLTLEDLSDVQLKSIGYTDEQVAEIRKLAEEAEKAGTPLNELISKMERPSGRELLFESIGNIGQSLITLFESIGKAYEKIFPSNERSEKLYQAIAAFERFTEALVISEDASKNITRAFEGLFAAIDIVATVTGGALKFAFNVFKEILGLLNVDIFEFAGNIGEAVVKLRDWIDEHNLLKDAAKGVAEVVVNMVDAVERTIGAVDEWIDKFVQIPEVQATITAFEKKVGTALENIKGFFRGGAEVVGNFFESLRNMDSISLEGVKNAFQKFRSDLKAYFSGIDIDLSGIQNFFINFKDKVVEIFKNLRDDASGTISEFRENVSEGFDQLGEVFEKAKAKVKEFVAYLKEKFGDVSIGNIISLGIGVGIFTLATKLDNIVEFLQNPLEMLEGIADAFSKKLKAEAFATKFEAISEGMIKISIAIGILVAAIAILTQLDWDKVKQAGGMLALLAGGLLVFAGAMKLFKLEDGFATTIVAFSAAMLIMVVALEKLLDITTTGDGIVEALGVLAGIATALVILLAVMQKIKPGDVKGSISTAISLISLAASLKMVVDSLEKITNLTVTAGDIGVFASVVLALMGLVKSLGSISGSSLKLVGVIAIPIAIKLLIGALEDIAKYDPSGFEKNIEAFIVVFGSLGLLMLATKAAGEHAAKAGVAIIAIAAAIRLLVPTIKELGEMNPDTAKQGLAIVGILELIMGAMIALSALAGEHAAKAGFMLIEMSAALLILSGVLVIVSEIAEHNPEGLKRALLVVITLEAVMGVLIGLSAYASEIKGVKGTLITLTVAISLLALSIAGLSLLDEKSIMTASGSLALIMGMFAAMVAASSLAKKANGTIILMTAVVGALAGILWALDELEVDTSIQTAGALSILMGSLSASMLILSNVKTVSGSALLALGGVELALLALGGVLWVLEEMDVNPSIETALSLSILMGALTGVCVVLSTMGKASGIVTAATKGVVAFDIVIAGIAGLIMGLGACMKYIPNCEEFIELGLPILTKIGIGIGEFVGGLISGFGAGLMAGLPKIGDYLSEFMDNLQPFLSGIENVDAGTVAAVGFLAAALIALTGASFLSGLDSLLSKIPGWPGMDDFASKLTSLGEAVAGFASEVGDVDATAVKASAEAGVLLAKLANSLPAYGGKLQEWFGEKMDLTTFGQHIIAFAEALSGYSKALTAEGAFNAEAVEASAAAAMTLSELANSLPKYGGKLQEWFGETMDLTTFGEHIKAFAGFLADYSRIVSADGAINSKAIEASVAAATMLSDLANGLPKYGGVLQEWFGGTQVTLDQFGQQMMLFGTSLVGYSAMMSTEGAINPTAITASKTAADVLVTLANSLPTYNGTIAEWFLGDKMDLKTFGEQLGYFGEGLLDYSISVSGVNADSVEKTARAAVALSDLAHALPTKQIFDGKVTLEKFGGQLSSFGEDLADYYDEVSEVSLITLNGVIDTTFRLISLAKGMTNLDTSGMSAFGKALKKLGDEGIEEFISSFKNAEDDAKAAVKTLLTNVVSGVTAKKSEVTTAFSTLMDESVGKINSRQQDFLISGKTIMVGLINGIEQKRIPIYTAVTSILETAYAKANLFQQHFLISGKTIMVGLIAGIEQKATPVYTAVTTIINRAYMALNSYQSMFMSAGSAIADSAVKGMDSKYTSAYSAGANLVWGFAAGIEDTAYAAEVAARAMADAAVAAAEEALDENSPSKRMYSVGDYAGIGFVNALLGNVKNAESAADELGKSSIAGLKDALARIKDSVNDNIDAQPVIRPVLDLTDVERSARKIDAAFSRSQAVSISNERSRSASAVIQNGESAASTGGNSFSFTQNNYSPKALSRIEIYRQTKNQFSAMERKVKA